MEEKGEVAAVVVVAVDGESNGLKVPARRRANAVLDETTTTTAASLPLFPIQSYVCGLGQTAYLGGSSRVCLCGERRTFCWGGEEKYTTNGVRIVLDIDRVSEIESQPTKRNANIGAVKLFTFNLPIFLTLSELVTYGQGES